MTRTRTLRTGDRRAVRGVTLIELLVVLAVVATVLAIVLPQISGGSATAEIRGAARELAAGLRYARSRAINRNSEVVLVIDLDNQSYGIAEERSPTGLPRTLDVELVTAESEQLDARRGGIRFYPDGTSTGGRVALSADGQTMRVAVDWLTGRVEIGD